MDRLIPNPKAGSVSLSLPEELRSLAAYVAWLVLAGLRK